MRIHCAKKLTLGPPEEALLLLPDEEDALLLELVRRLGGESSHFRPVESHLRRRLHGLQVEETRLEVLHISQSSFDLAAIISRRKERKVRFFASYSTPGIRRRNHIEMGPLPMLRDRSGNAQWKNGGGNARLFHKYDSQHFTFCGPYCVA